MLSSSSSICLCIQRVCLRHWAEHRWGEFCSWFSEYPPLLCLQSICIILRLPSLVSVWCPVMLKVSSFLQCWDRSHRSHPVLQTVFCLINPYVHLPLQTVPLFAHNNVLVAQRHISALLWPLPSDLCVIGRYWAGPFFYLDIYRHLTAWMWLATCWSSRGHSVFMFGFFFSSL